MKGIIRNYALKAFQRKASFPLTSVRSYHSYPDESEKPQITQSISSVKKQLESKDDRMDKKFAFDKPFPGIQAPQGLSNSNLPKTMQSKLNNGLTVASQEVPGFMTSFALVVRAGR
jgi:hypothetical protein